MANDTIIRKIAVIFATDVVGFSELMEKNENVTLKSPVSYTHLPLPTNREV